jgi:hypothetical protein
MLRQLTLLGLVALASGCAHQTYENRVVVSDTSSPYVTAGTYRAGYGYDYGMYGATEYDNTSKGAGARTMMQNPYVERTFSYGTYSTMPTGAIGYNTVYAHQYGMYGPSEYDNTSKGAGARAMMQNPHAEGTYAYGYYTVPAAGGAVSTGETETDTTSKGAGARSITGKEE